MGPTGFITLLAGWVTTEAGRQPWVVYGVMRTADAVSPVTAQQVGVSLLAFVIVYTIVFGTGIYYLLKLLRHGPALPGSPAQSSDGSARASAQPCRNSPSKEHKNMDLTLAWAAIIAFGLFLYVVLDGFDLGIGILFPFFPDQHDRDVMMNTVAPVWDGNETWLVLGGAGLFAAFPMVYSTVLSALYLPLVLMLVCLIFRGVSFEIRAKAQRTKPCGTSRSSADRRARRSFRAWRSARFSAAFPSPMAVSPAMPFGWFSPFSIFTGGALVVTYALLGACWLIAKTEGDLQRRMYRVVWPLTVLQLATIAVVSIWTPLQDAGIASRWFDSPLFYRLLPVPVLVAACAWAMRRSIQSRHEKRPFAMALGFVLLGYAGLVASISPHEIFPGVSIWDAAAPRSSQLFTIVGAAVILPVIVAYTTFGYWVFRGKVRHGEHHYH